MYTQDIHQKFCFWKSEIKSQPSPCVRSWPSQCCKNPHFGTLGKASKALFKSSEPFCKNLFISLNETAAVWVFLGIPGNPKAPGGLWCFSGVCSPGGSGSSWMKRTRAWMSWWNTCPLPSMQSRKWGIPGISCQEIHGYLGIFLHSKGVQAAQGSAGVPIPEVVPASIIPWFCGAESRGNLGVSLELFHHSRQKKKISQKSPNKPKFKLWDYSPLLIFFYLWSLSISGWKTPPSVGRDAGFLGLLCSEGFPGSCAAQLRSSSRDILEIGNTGNRVFFWHLGCWDQMWLFGS